MICETRGSSFSWPCKKKPQLGKCFTLDSILTKKIIIETISRVSKREAVNVTGGLRNITCECRLDGTGVAFSAVKRKVCMMRSSIRKPREAVFWLVSAVGRKNSHEFKQQQGKF